MVNPYEALKRKNKADRLAHELFMKNRHSSDVAEMTQDEWLEIANQAGVNKPSAPTQSMVLAILKIKEEEHGNRDSKS